MKTLRIIGGTEVDQAKVAVKARPIPTLGEVFSIYMERKREKIKSSTIENYEQLFSCYLSDWSATAINNITRKMVSDRHVKLSNRKSGYGRGNAQADGAMRLVRSLFNFACAYFRDEFDEPLYSQNPVDVLKETATWNKRYGRKNYIKPDDLKAFWRASAACEHPQVRDWLRFTLFSGFRRSESRLLKWSNLDFKKRTITIETTKNNDQHVIPMTAYLYELLTRRKQDCPLGIDYVFHDLAGRNLPIAKGNRSIEGIQVDSGLSFSCHDLRRSYANAMYRCELSEVVIKTLLNHRSRNASVTYKHYLETDIDGLRAPAEKVAEYLLAYCLDGAKIDTTVEKPRIRLTLSQVKPSPVTIAETTKTDIGKSPKSYKRPNYDELVKNAEANQARVNGGVEF